MMFPTIRNLSSMVSFSMNSYSHPTTTICLPTLANASIFPIQEKHSGNIRMNLQEHSCVCQSPSNYCLTTTNCSMMYSNKYSSMHKACYLYTISLSSQ